MFFKSRVEKLEDEFKTDKLKNKYMFYDLNIRAADPEEVRTFSSEVLQELGFYPILNKFTKFEDVELEGIFTGGRLKPVKSVIKGVKKVKRGPKYGLLWKLLSLIGIGLLIYYLIPGNVPNYQVLYLSILFLLLSLFVYMIKKTLVLEVWVKLAGIYDVSSEKSDLRVIIASDAKDRSRESFKILEEDINEFYNELASKYVKKRATPVIKVRRGVSPRERMLSALQEVEKEISNLDTRLSKGEISEETYKEVKQRLERKREKLETMLDLLSVMQ